MNIYIPFALLLALICYLYRDNEHKAQSWFMATMILAFILAALRYEFGPDYYNYRDTFEYLKLYGVNAYKNDLGHSEPLFVSYMSIFPKYTLFLAVNSFLWFFLYEKILKQYSDYHYLWFVVLLLFFNVDCVLNNLVAMRQALGSFLFIPAFYALKDNKKWLFILLVVLATLFHTSVIVLLPLCLLNKKKESFIFSKWFFFIVIILTAGNLIVGRGTYLTMVSTFMVDSFEELQRYSSYIDQIGGNTDFKYFILLVLQIIPLIFVWLEGKKETDEDYILIYKLGIITSTITIILGHGLLSRYLMILNPFYIISIVRSLSNNRNFTVGLIVIIFVLFNEGYTFYNYVNADYSISFLEYHTIFSAPNIP